METVDTAQGAASITPERSSAWATAQRSFLILGPLLLLALFLCGFFWQVTAPPRGFLFPPLPHRQQRLSHRRPLRGRPGDVLAANSASTAPTGRHLRCPPVHAQRTFHRLARGRGPGGDSGPGPAGPLWLRTVPSAPPAA